MSNRLVTYARFQTSMFHPACGDIGNCLPSQSRKNEMTSLIMREGTHGLEVSLKKRILVIPWANLVGYEAVDDSPKPPAPVAVKQAA